MSHKTILEYIRTSKAYRQGNTVIRPCDVTSAMAAAGRQSEARVVVNVMGEMARAGELNDTPEGFVYENGTRTLLSKPWRKYSNAQLGIEA